MVTVVKVIEKECTCPNCSSVLSYSPYEKEEFKVHMDMYGDYDRVMGIRCPVCTKIVELGYGN